MSSAPAAEEKAPEAAPAAPARRKMKFKYKLLLIITSLLLMGLLRTGFVFFLVGMLPSIVTYYLDQSKFRFGFKTIFYCNLSGMLPFLARLLYYGPTSSILQDTMGNTYTWLIIFGAAGMGILLNSMGPMLAEIMIGQLHQTQVVRLQRSQKKIEIEWGKEVTQFGAHDEAKA
jgi:hypothetical protein